MEMLIRGERPKIQSYRPPAAGFNQKEKPKMMRNVGDMRAIANAEAQDWTYFDGSKRRLYYTDEAYELNNRVIIMLRTDPDGLILNGNQAFVDASGYSPPQLRGRPMALLRHPHMPRAVFREMWDTLEQGREWNGAIKNLRRDGSYYWAMTHIVPDINENNEIVHFIGTQRKMVAGAIRRQEALYAEMREREQSAPSKSPALDFFKLRLF